jgi:DNA-binding NarL/FixJ family response regulator
LSALPPATDDVARLVAIVGPEAALALVEARGGTRIYVGEAIEGRTVADIIGVEPAARLAEAYGRETVKVPLAREWRVLVYKARGLSYREIALKAGCSENTVWETLSRHRQTRAQLDLFKAG